GGQVELAVERALDVQAARLDDRRAECDQRAPQAELVEHLGSQAAGDRPDVLGAAAGGLADGLELDPDVLRRATRDRLAAQEEPGERLADLVVQLARDPLPLRLLGG